MGSPYYVEHIDRKALELGASGHVKFLCVDCLVSQKVKADLLISENIRKVKEAIKDCKDAIPPAIENAEKTKEETKKILFRG